MVQVDLAKLDQVFLLAKAQKKQQQQLFFHMLEGPEKLRLPTQLSCLEQKLKMFLRKKAPFSIYFLGLTKISSCGLLP